MKKKTITILIAAMISLTALTGCQGTSEPEAQETKTETAMEQEADAEEVQKWSLNKEVAESAPEGTVFIAPPLDADGNYPEGFKAEEYNGMAGNLYGTEEERAEAENTKKESKNKKENSKEEKGSEKDTTKQSDSEKKDDSKKEE